MDLAASVQAVIEEAMLRVCRHALRLTGSGHLCLAGGVALNCVANGRLLRNLPGLQDIWIQPAAGDAGGALGAALHLAHVRGDAPRHAAVGSGDGQRGSLLGPAFSDEAIEQALADTGLRAVFYEDRDEQAGELARLLADGATVGRSEGPMEFGPRALGNRSILADPRRADGQQHINLRIKFRESWRPFAPAVLAEHAGPYFEMQAESPYMLLVADVREQWRKPVDWTGFRQGDDEMLNVLNQERSTVPAITHADFSARVQTVDRARNPSFHALLSAFHDLTGCPMLVNTSFNVRGEPIVCTPEDAVQCFLKHRHRRAGGRLVPGAQGRAECRTARARGGSPFRTRLTAGPPPRSTPRCCCRSAGRTRRQGARYFATAPDPACETYWERPVSRGGGVTALAAGADAAALLAQAGEHWAAAGGSLRCCLTCWRCGPRCWKRRRPPATRPRYRFPSIPCSRPGQRQRRWTAWSPSGCRSRARHQKRSTTGRCSRRCSASTSTTTCCRPHWRWPRRCWVRRRTRLPRPPCCRRSQPVLARRSGCSQRGTGARRA